MSRFWENKEYDFLEDQSEDDRLEKDTNLKKRKATSSIFGIFRIPLLFLVVMIYTLAVSLASFNFGQPTYSPEQNRPYVSSSGINLPIHPKTFIYNITYATSTPSSDAAWSSLFPKRGTFFHHPTIAAQKKISLSVYHQLHCLDSLRQGIWSLHALSSPENQKANMSMPAMATLPHLRHCIDLLRQTLMCHGDTTVEVWDEDLEGVTGFGVERQCRDYSELVRWTEEWKDEYSV